MANFKVWSITARDKTNFERTEKAMELFVKHVFPIKCNVEVAVENGVVETHFYVSPFNRCDMDCEFFASYNPYKANGRPEPADYVSLTYLATTIDIANHKVMVHINNYIFHMDMLTKEERLKTMQEN
jgi:hypothetical protein